MPTLLYSPGIRVIIDTGYHGTIDVSDDIESGSLILTENAPHKFGIVLANHRRKYDRVFTPNDRISVQMKRLTWVQVFSGYLDEVPYFSTYPRSVQLNATCTLKRLVYRPWDDGTPASRTLLNFGAGSQDTDGGIRDKVVKLLTDVGEWPEQNIHIGRMPKGWYDKIAALQQRLADRLAVNNANVGAGPVTYGVSVTGAGATTVTQEGKFTGVLPSLSGKGSWFGGPNQTDAVGGMALTGEPGRTPKDVWYCAMRWPYQGYVNGHIKAYGTGTETRAAIKWWVNQRILVTNPKNNKSVVLRPADWGPGGVPRADDRVIDMSKTALETLGATTDDELLIRFAPQNSQPGPALINFTTADAKRVEQDLPPRSVTRTTPTVQPEIPHPITDYPTPVVQGASGLRFTDGEQLQGNVRAARDFIKTNWPGKPGIGGYAYRPVSGTKTLSDHAKGLALDVMVNTRAEMPTPDEQAYGNAVARWFASNPEAFGVKYIIWTKQINTRTGWRAYHHPGGSSGVTLDHYDHVHISFKDTGQAGVGAMGSPLPGADMKDFGEFASGSGAQLQAATDGEESSGNLINAGSWYALGSAESIDLYGIRALMNDRPLWETVLKLTNASMRNCMSAPNGDFIAWFPDYFGEYGTAGKMNIKDIEISGDGFTVQWSDERLVTHQYATGATFPSNEFYSTQTDISRMQITAGIATVEFPEIMEALFNINPKDPRAAGFLDADTILQRFGARPDHQPMGSIYGAQAEFWYALALFQRNWAQQFTAAVYLTFMPELFPGMLIRVDSSQFQAYVTSVIHNFNFTDGVGFSTSVTIMAPSSTGDSGLFGLPRSGDMPQPKAASKDSLPPTSMPDKIKISDDKGRGGV